MNLCRRFTRCLLPLLALCMSAAASPGLAAAVPPLPGGTRVMSNLPYVPGGDPAQVLDLYLPPGEGPWPLVIYLHGGGLLGGSKDEVRNAAVPTLVPAGYAVASVNYRFVSQAPFPAPIEDAKTACGWLKANAARLGIDPARFGAWGHSAGALLAGLLATTADSHTFERDGAAGDCRVRAAVVWSGRCDLTLVQSMSEQERKIVEGYLGGGPIAEHLDLARAASPLTYLNAGDPPLLIIHGDHDTVANVGQTAIWERAGRAAGVDVTVLVRPGMEHGVPADYDFGPVKAFFERTLSSGGTVSQPPAPPHQATGVRETPGGSGS